MKQLILAAVAATFVFASAVQAAPANTSNEQAANDTKMTAEACKEAMDKCGADQACKDALVKQGCEAPKS